MHHFYFFILHSSLSPVLTLREIIDRVSSQTNGRHLTHVASEGNALVVQEYLENMYKANNDHSNSEALATTTFNKYLRNIINLSGLYTFVLYTVQSVYL